MTETERIVPELRFKGFIDDWEQRKLGELASVYDGTHQTPDYKDKGVMFLSVENIKTLKSKKYISEEAFSKEFTIRPEKNDVLMTRIGDVGTANVVADDTPIAYYVSLALLKSKLLNPFFLQASIHSPFMKDELWKRTLHIAFPKKINKNEIANVPISYPSIEEQTKIGSFFKQLDDTIALHQRKLTLLEQLKQTYLQVMFPQGKESIPKLRFTDHSEPWEQRKLGEVGSVVMCKRIFKDQTTAFGDIPFYKIGTFGGSPDSFIPNDLFEEYKKNYPYPEIGDILMSASGTIGRTVVYEGEKAYYQDSNIVWLKTEKSLIDNSFLKQFYQVVKWSGLEGSTIKRLYNSNILSTGINLPSLREQTKLGTFFNQIDNTIALHQEKIAHLKALKSTLLNKMFI